MEVLRYYPFIIRRFGVQAVLLMHVPFFVLLAIGG